MPHIEICYYKCLFLSATLLYLASLFNLAMDEREQGIARAK